MNHPALMLSPLHRCLKITVLAICFTHALIGCQSMVDSGQSEESSMNDTPPPKAYTPPPGYAPSTKDPLLALYGGKKPGASSSVTDAELSSDFDQLREVKLTAAIPSRWRKILNRLGRKLPLKVSSWRSLTGTRMERGLKNRELALTIKFLARKSDLLTSIPQHLSKLKELKGLPKRFGDQHDHDEERGSERTIIKYHMKKSDDNKADPLSLATLEVTWSNRPAEPSKLDKNCRYVHGLAPQLGSGVVEWAAQHFKSTSTRRFVEWSIERTPKKIAWQATWIYRNGSYRDKAVGWWTDRLRSRGATQTSFTGLEQSWSLKSGGDIEWWPETDPSPMGCKIAGPLLTISATIPKL